MPRHLRTWTALGTLMIALTAVACTDAGRDATTRTDTAAGTGSMLRVTEVDLGRAIGADKRVTDETDDFNPNDTIYASVVTDGSAREARLTARWTFEDGQVVEETSQTITPTGGTTVTEFHISRPGGWPEGRYTLRVLLDGREVETADFEVR